MGISGAKDMQNEILKRGPIACGIDAAPILNYTSGIATDRGEGVDHVISVTGWGHDDKLGSYWIVRNSWGEYWGEMVTSVCSSANSWLRSSALGPLSRTSLRRRETTKSTVSRAGKTVV